MHTQAHKATMKYAFLQDNSFPIVGVNVGGDIACIGCGFGVQRIVDMRRLNRVQMQYCAEWDNSSEGAH